MGEERADKERERQARGWRERSCLILSENSRMLWKKEAGKMQTEGILLQKGQSDVYITP